MSTIALTVTGAGDSENTPIGIGMAHQEHPAAPIESQAFTREEFSLEGQYELFKQAIEWCGARSPQQVFTYGGNEYDLAHTNKWLGAIDAEFGTELEKAFISLANPHTDMIYIAQDMFGESGKPSLPVAFSQARSAFDDGSLSNLSIDEDTPTVTDVLPKESDKDLAIYKQPTTKNPLERLPTAIKNADESVVSDADIALRQRAETIHYLQCFYRSNI